MGNYGRAKIVKYEGTNKEILGNLQGFVPLVVGYPIYFGGGALSGDQLDNYPPNLDTKTK